MNADGSAMRAVTSRGLDERASYLPDGRILYYRGSSHVWVVANPDGYPHSKHSDSPALGLVVRTAERESNRVEAEPESQRRP